MGRTTRQGHEFSAQTQSWK